MVSHEKEEHDEDIGQLSSHPSPSNFGRRRLPPLEEAIEAYTETDSYAYTKTEDIPLAQAGTL